MGNNIEVTVKPGLKPELGHVDGIPTKALDKTPTLIQNDTGSFKMVPKYLADEMVKAHTAVIMRPTDPDYLDGIKLGLGVWEGFKKGEVIQMRGKAVRPEDIGTLDIEAIIKQAQAEVAAAAKDGGEKVAPVNELPPGMARFQERERSRARKRGE